MSNLKSWNNNIIKNTILDVYVYALIRKLKLIFIERLIIITNKNEVPLFEKKTD